MKAQTVQQPWAWCLFHGKDVENRSWDTKHRGELAIHAGKRISERGLESPLYRAALSRETSRRRHYIDQQGVILGMVNVDATHKAHEGCCDSPWGEQAYVEHGGKTRRDVFHWEVSGANLLRDPIPVMGRLGLWTVPDDVVDLIREQLRS